MDNQLIKPETLIQQIIIFVVAMLIAIPLVLFCIQIVQASDPYVKSVLSIQGDPVQGKAIFLINCAGCHGLEANGLVGPSLHEISKYKSRYGLIHQVTSGDTPPMPKFQPSSQEMADLLSYLESL
ncbi:MULTISPECIES: cytochrome c [unclassified Anabaena]|uniref:c-type cytochrome n=1 Tax=unclassified Anabaena TaxID=2619674 RepID=UPI00144823D1|nr:MULTISPECIES: cytochrome c [unclassified Anabaena]MTJ07284.1 cytochrome c [Anabaena sp. UHCC 0204]MTJ55167.1 cytochrome c [Anabaena sp. UHCC 0253]